MNGDDIMRDLCVAENVVLLDLRLVILVEVGILHGQPSQGAQLLLRVPVNEPVLLVRVVGLLLRVLPMELAAPSLAGPPPEFRRHGK